ncbi:hypothetical protein N7478_013126 [Penicillium angulare]|uniref:uncharacterized protein n=1 Tax=Penicillium angulare TaxID=116970 RepID=UPI00254027A4|nr:uncharacterized protein N7478_013126 [Penicillium angulare]KAJ5257022.1 hypothetical protein N7478_013126 [Penicillium angulare]
MTAPRTTPRNSGPFFFLQHFASPSVKKDRLAIGETAKFSMRRNLESIYSHLENALVPSEPFSTSSLSESLQGPEFSFLLPSTIDDSLLSQYSSDVLFPSKLSNQLTDLTTELVETSKSMASGTTESPRILDMMELTALFGVPNISTFISAFFQTLHWHLPIVHFPTFDPGNVSNPLLLAIFLAGASYATPLDGISLSPLIFDVAEEYIFRKILNLTTTQSSKDPRYILPTVQLIQGALIMEMLQFGRDDMATRRRIRIMRHPCLVSTIRSLGIFQLKRGTAPKAHDDRTWNILVAEEVCIRIACWVFLADGFLTVCFKNHPALSIFEMDCHLPWPAELWEAEDAATFAKIAATQSNEHTIPPLKDVVTQLLEASETEPLIPWSQSLSPEDLLILIYALSSLAFQTRTGLLKFLPFDTIFRGAKNWKRIWDSVIDSLDQKQFLHLGYPKHAEELWWLLTATLDIANNPEQGFAYLNNTATDELGNLNDFIQWCHQSTT